MADAYKTLYQGQLPASVTTLATVGVGKAWIVGHITVVNVTGAAINYRLYKNGSTDAYAITPSMHLAAFGMHEWDGIMSMAAAEYIAGYADAASSVTVTIDGDEVG